jgi:hypothetical protein
MKNLRLLAVILFLSTILPAQATAPQPTPTVPANPPTASAPRREAAGPDDATKSPVTPAKITPQQADELFRSVDEILNFISQDTGLKIKHPVKRRLADREQVEQYISSHMKDDQDAARLQRSEIVLKKFGLVPRDFNLQKFMLALLKEQVAGYYDAKTKTVNLLDWVSPDEQKPVLAHELTHALQDQNVGLVHLSKGARKDDPSGLAGDERMTAREAVVEGQAMLVAMDYMLAPMGTSVARQPQLVEAMQAGMSVSSPGMTLFNSAPVFLQESLMFPYRYGALFERKLLLAGGKEKAYAETLRKPPEDSRQIMQPDTYLAHEKVPMLKPLDFEKLAHGYKRWDLSAMGQFDVYLLLSQYTNVHAARDTSTLWRGGYYWAGELPGVSKDAKLATTSDIAMVYISRWSDDLAAQQFAGVYAQNVPKRYAGAKQVEGLVMPELQPTPPAPKPKDAPQGAAPQADTEKAATKDENKQSQPAGKPEQAQTSQTESPKEEARKGDSDTTSEEEDTPKPAEQVTVTVMPFLNGAAVWQTSEGQVSVEARGDKVVIIESLDANSAKAVRDAAFGEKDVSRPPSPVSR